MNKLKRVLNKIIAIIVKSRHRKMSIERSLIERKGSRLVMGEMFEALREIKKATQSRPFLENIYLEKEKATC